MPSNRFDILRVLASSRENNASVREPSGPVCSGQILVPLSLERHESSAISLALQWAERCQLGVTLLRVLPVPGRKKPVSNFEAVDELFSAAWHFSCVPTRKRNVESRHLCRAEVTAFLLKHVNSNLWRTMQPRVKVRHGKWAEEIVRFAQRPEIELVFLPGRPWLWGLPFVAPATRRVVRRLKKPLLVVGPTAPEKVSRPAENRELVH